MHLSLLRTYLAGIADTGASEPDRWVKAMNNHRYPGITVSNDDEYQHTGYAAIETLEKVFSFAICRQSGDKWQSKTMFLTNFVLRSQIVLTLLIPKMTTNTQISTSMTTNTKRKSSITNQNHDHRHQKKVSGYTGHVSDNKHVQHCPKSAITTDTKDRSAMTTDIL